MAEARPRLPLALERIEISLDVRDVSLAEVLHQISIASRLGVVLPGTSLDAFRVTLKLERIGLRTLVEYLESLFPVRVRESGGVLLVELAEDAGPALLVYPLPGGMVERSTGDDFASLRDLSFVSRSENGDTRSIPAESPASHLERFLEKVPGLFTGTEVSRFHLDRRQNLLFIRGPRERLEELRRCLDLLTKEPITVEIEARFLEVRTDRLHELGTRLELTSVMPFHRNDLGQTVIGLGEGSGSIPGLRVPVLREGEGLRLSILGIASQPRFEALIRALDESGDAEVLAAPVVTAVNNVPATLAITRNLPYVEDYRPVLNRELVSGDGITETESSAALVAVINDENFTGIVLKVTPSVGSPDQPIQLRIQPVVRDQVDAVTISGGAVVQGITTPSIQRPVIETRYQDTQLGLPDGGTVILGGLHRKTRSTVRRSVPLLGSIPILGRLFRYDSESLESRELLITVHCRICWPRDARQE